MRCLGGGEWILQRLIKPYPNASGEDRRIHVEQLTPSDMYPNIIGDCLYPLQSCIHVSV